MKEFKIRSEHLKKLVTSSLFLALALVMPFMTGQIPEIGSMLCPMHVPVLLCGFICGWGWGLAVGAVAPILRSLLFFMPPMYPAAVCMAFELAAYGAVSGIARKYLPKKKIYVYPTLIAAMLAGRAVWGIARFITSGLDASKFGFSAFIAGAFTTALPGIVLQLVLIPPIVMLYDRIKENRSL